MDHGSETETIDLFRCSLTLNFPKPRLRRTASFPFGNLSILRVCTRAASSPHLSHSCKMVSEGMLHVSDASAVRDVPLKNITSDGPVTIWWMELSFSSATALWLQLLQIMESRTVNVKGQLYSRFSSRTAVMIWSKCPFHGLPLPSILSNIWTVCRDLQPPKRRGKPPSPGWIPTRRSGWSVVEQTRARSQLVEFACDRHRVFWVSFPGRMIDAAPPQAFIS